MQSHHAFPPDSRTAKPQAVSALSAFLLPLRRPAAARTLAAAGVFAEEERRALAALLLRCGQRAVSFYGDGWERRYAADGETRSPLRAAGTARLMEERLSAPLRGTEEAAAFFYFFHSAEEAGCAALAADGAGLAGAAFFPLSGAETGAVFFGGGTASALLSPGAGAFPDGAAADGRDGSAWRRRFLGACLLYGAGAPSFLTAADRIRRAEREGTCYNGWKSGTGQGGEP